MHTKFHVTGIPILTYSFIDWIKKQDTKDKTLVEFGSGNSTIFFSKLFKKVITHEHDEDYIRVLIDQKINNLQVFDLNFNFFLTPIFMDNIKNTDYVLIDTHPRIVSREFIAKHLVNDLGYNKIIILDNSNLNPGAYFFLRRNYQFFADFGWLNPLQEETLTSVFCNNPIDL